MDPPSKELDRWRIVQSALESWSRTIRLCVILLAFGTPLDAIAWVLR